MKNTNIKRLIKGVKKLDLFEKPVQLLIKKDEGHKTIFGALLTMTISIIMLILLITQLQQLSNRSNPFSYSTEIYHHAPDYYKLDEKNFTIGFGLQNSDYSTYIDESVFVVNAYILTKSSTVKNEELITEYNQYPINLLPCSVGLLRQEELKDYFIGSLDLPTNYCIDWDSMSNLNIQGTWDSQTYSSIQIEFLVCNEQTRKPNGPKCKSDEEIQKALAGNFFSIALSSYTVDLTDSNLPLKPMGQDFYTTTSSLITKEITFYMSPITINTDFGLISEDILENKSVRFARTTELLDLNSNVNFLRAVFRLETTENLHIRKYTKIQDILSNLGGLWQVLFSIALILQKPVSELSFKIQILNSLFNFEGQKEKIPQKNVSSHAILDSNFASPRNLLEQLEQNRGKKNFQNQNSVQTQVKQRLQSIMVKNQQIQDMNDDSANLEMKQKISVQISQSIKRYFQLVSKKLKLNCFEYVYFLRCLTQNDQSKQQQIEFATQRMDKSLDILYLIKKLSEIDKLKMILLTQDQIQVFDYLPKPTIPMNPSKQSPQNQYFSILRPVKTDYQRALDARNAFQEILKDPKNPVNRNLINCMDQQIIDLLQINQQTSIQNIEQIDEEKSSIKDIKEEEDEQTLNQNKIKYQNDYILQRYQYASYFLIRLI
ncbi:hypothetical protein pb186bvf_003692 [Paramecium bursaria]